MVGEALIEEVDVWIMVEFIVGFAVGVTVGFAVGVAVKFAVDMAVPACEPVRLPDAERVDVRVLDAVMELVRLLVPVSVGTALAVEVGGWLGVPVVVEVWVAELELAALDGDCVCDWVGSIEAGGVLVAVLKGEEVTG